MSELRREMLDRRLLVFDRNNRDLSHMTTIAAHIEFLTGRNRPTRSAKPATSIDTARTVALHLAIRTSTALWNERDALCI
jgi:hypothetical protein